MPNFAELLQQGGAHAWLYFPSAILLGALHGLEPGHSKTMMAAFIVAIRGSVKQAVFLGLAATLSHTAVVWLVAIVGMYLGKGLDAQTTEPYFQIASSALIILIALWMLWRTWRGEQMFKFEHGDDHHHGEHDHGHHDETHRIDTGHGRIEVSIFEEGMPPHWRLKTLTGHAWPASDVCLTTNHDLIKDMQPTPMLVAELVEEVVRYDSPVQNTRRFVAKRCTIGGSVLEAGDTVLVLLVSANRDPYANPDPDSLLLKRTQRRTFSFGSGRHECPGQQLALTIASEAILAWLHRQPASSARPYRWSYLPSLNGRIPQFYRDRETQQ